MNFKDQMRADVGAVFLNQSEFAVTVRLEGLEVPGLWSDSAEPYREYHHEDLPRLPLDVGERVLQIAEGTLDVLPQQEIEVDGEWWQVRRVQPCGGMLRLVLFRNVGF